MYTLGLIGESAEGIGYGNISIRHGQNQFIISGSATGKIKELNNQHYTLVTGYSIETNSLAATGPIIASSESLTHAVIYDYDKSVNAVIHIHHLGLWKALMNQVPTTENTVEYGTPDMAKEMIRLFKETNLAQQKILVMAGHEEGIITFGKNIEEAGAVLLEKYYNL
jgi:L-ribulose-5-phosphate 4-epimerase